MDKSLFYSAVREFLATVVDRPSGTQAIDTLTEDDDLYQLNLVDSLVVIRMIIFVEELTGTEIDLEDHDFETFYTLKGIYVVAQSAIEAAQ
jgi:acyl carrier protein